jgi:hypothetical protein
LVERYFEEWINSPANDPGQAGKRGCQAKPVAATTAS